MKEYTLSLIRESLMKEYTLNLIRGPELRKGLGFRV